MNRYRLPVFLPANVLLLLTGTATLGQSPVPPPLAAIEKFVAAAGSTSSAYSIAAAYPYKTVDSGATWIPLYLYDTPRDLLIGVPIENYSPALSLGVDPLDPDRVFVGIPQQAGGIRRSADGGVSWTAVGGIPRTPGNIVAFFFPRPGLIFAQGSGQIFKSTDGGASWIVAGPMQRPTGGLDINPADPSKMWNWEATFAASFHRSVDEGKTWSFLSVNRGDNFPGVASELRSHPTRPNQIYAVGGRGGVDGIYRSENGGDLFNRLLPGQNFLAGPNGRIFIDRSLANRIYFSVVGQPGTAAEATFCYAQQETDANILCSAIEGRSFIPIFVDSKADNSILWAFSAGVGNVPQRLCLSTTAARTWTCATPTVRPTLFQGALSRSVRESGVRTDEVRPIALEPRTVRRDAAAGRLVTDTRYEVPYTVAAPPNAPWASVSAGQTLVTPSATGGTTAPGIAVTMRGYLAPDLYTTGFPIESAVANNGGARISVIMRVVPRDTDEMRYTYSVISGPDPAISVTAMGLDTQGLLYTAATNRIRRRNADGSWTIIAGTGGSGAPSGDNGPAVAAVLGGLNGMIVEPGGTILYTNATGLRRVGPDGIVRVLLAPGAAIATGGGATVPYRGIGAMAIDNGNRLYVGFTGGIARLSADRSSAERIYTAPAANPDVSYLQFDRQNRLWASLGPVQTPKLLRFDATLAATPQDMGALRESLIRNFSFDTNNNLLLPSGAEVVQISIEEATTRTIAGNGGSIFSPTSNYANFASLGGVTAVISEAAGTVLVALEGRILRLTPDRKPLPTIARVGRPNDPENPPRRSGPFLIEGANFGERIEDVTVYIDAIAATVQSVTPTAITGIVPLGTFGVQASVGVVVSNLPSVIGAWTLAPSQVELVRIPGTDLVQALFADGTTHSAENPAEAGIEITISAYGVDARVPRSSVAAKIGDADAEIFDAAPGAGNDGLFIVKLRVPATLTEAGSYPCVLIVDGTASEPLKLNVKAK